MGGEGWGIGGGGGGGGGVVVFLCLSVYRICLKPI